MSSPCKYIEVVVLSLNKIANTPSSEETSPLKKHPKSAEAVLALVKRQRTSGSLASEASNQMRASADVEENTSAQASIAFKKQITSLGIDPDNPIRDLESRCEWKGDVGLTLTAFRLPGTAVLTWKNGPNEGKIYDLVPIPMVPVLTREGMLENLDKGLRKLHGTADGPGFQARLFVDYFIGKEERPSLQELRFCDKGLNMQETLRNLY